MLIVAFLTPHSVPVHLHNTLWFPLRVSLRTLRFRDPTTPCAYILQCHGSATVTGRAEVACESQNAYVFDVDGHGVFIPVVDD